MKVPEADRTSALVHTLYCERIYLHSVGFNLSYNSVPGLQINQKIVTAYPQVILVRVPTPTVQSDSDITVLRHLEKLGCRLINRPQAILNCINKFWTFQELAGHGIPLPDTFSYGKSQRPHRLVLYTMEPWVSIITLIRWVPNGEYNTLYFNAPKRKSPEGALPTASKNIRDISIPPCIGQHCFYHFYGEPFLWDWNHIKLCGPKHGPY